MRKKPQKPLAIKKPGKAAEAANQTAQVAPMRKRPQNQRRKPGKAAEADPDCAVRTTHLKELGPMV
jgi:hypothetical protein